MKSSRASYADLRACGAGMPEQYLFCTDNSKMRQVTWRHPPTTAASGDPGRTDSNRFEPARFDPDLLLRSQQRAELSWYASCCYHNSCHGTAVEAPVSLQPLPGFPHCRARLLQLIGADR